LYFRTFSLLVGRERVEEEEEGEEEESRASSCLYIVCCFSCPSLPDACAPVARERDLPAILISPFKKTNRSRRETILTTERERLLREGREG